MARVVRPASRTMLQLAPCTSLARQGPKRRLCVGVWRNHGCEGGGERSRLPASFTLRPEWTLTAGCLPLKLAGMVRLEAGRA